MIFQELYRLIGSATYFLTKKIENMGKSNKFHIFFTIFVTKSKKILKIKNAKKSHRIRIFNTFRKFKTRKILEYDCK